MNHRISWRSLSMKANILFVAWALGLITLLGVTGVAVARSSYYFSPSDVSGSTWSWLVVGETNYVRKAEMHVRVYFDSPRGNKIFIENMNYCTGGAPDIVQSGDKIAQDGMTNGKKVTRFTFGTVDSNGGNAPKTLFGRKYIATSNCSGDTNVGLYSRILGPESQDLKLRYDRWLKKYWLPVDVEHIDERWPSAYDGIQNMFRIRAETSDGTTPQIWQSENKTGYGVTVEQAQELPKYSNYTVRFGSNCSFNPASEKLYFYDLDNAGGGGAQPTDGPEIKVKLYKGLPGEAVDNQIKLSGGGGRNGPDGKTWIPGNIANGKAEPSFVMQPGYKYKIVIEDVYENNTLQFSTPTDGVFWERPCDNTEPTLNIQCDGSPRVFGIAWDKDLNGVENDDGSPRKYKVELLYGNGDPVAGVGAQFTTRGDKRYSFDISDTGRGYKVRVTDYDNYGNNKGYQTTNPTGVLKDVGCASRDITCSVVDAVFVVGTDDTFKVTLKNNSGAFGSPNIFVWAKNSAGNIVAGSSSIQIDASKYTGKNTKTITSPDIPISPGAVNIFTIYAKVVLQDGTQIFGPSDGDCGEVKSGRQPFFNVEGGDIVSRSDVFGHVKATKDDKGSAGQIAIFAGLAGKIQGVRPGLGLPDVSNRTSLAFANIEKNLPPSGALYGGGLDANLLPTLDPEYSDFGGTDYNSGTLDLSTLDAGEYKYTYSGTFPLKLRGDVAAGTRVIIDSSKAVYITENITYNSGNDIDSLPLLVVHAPRIVVVGSVSEIHGIFHADNNFYTCGLISGPTYTSFKQNEYDEICNNTSLKVYGAVITKNLHLSRTKGNWPTSDPAEMFYYTPEVWLPRGQRTYKYDSFVSLPPVL